MNKESIRDQEQNKYSVNIDINISGSVHRCELEHGCELEHVNCDLCGHEDLEILYRQKDERFHITDFKFPVVRCLNCGLCFLNPRPSYDSIGIFYPESFYQIRDSQKNIRRYAIEASYLPKGRKRLLDIGCHEGEFMQYMTVNKGYETVGVEPGKILNPNNLDIYNCDLLNAKFDQDSFDVITAWAVFEHLHRPKAYFHEVSRILKPGGLFVFLVTNHDSIASKYLFSEDIPRHLYYYSEKTIEEYCKLNELNLISIRHSNDIFRSNYDGWLLYYFYRILGIELGHNNLKYYSLLRAFGKSNISPRTFLKESGRRKITYKNLCKGDISLLSAMLRLPIEILDHKLSRFIGRLMCWIKKNQIIICSATKNRQ